MKDPQIQVHSDNNHLKVDPMNVSRILKNLKISEKIEQFHIPNDSSDDSEELAIDDHPLDQSINSMHIAKQIESQNKKGDKIIQRSS